MIDNIGTQNVLPEYVGYGERSEFGTGRDGDATISSSETINLQTESLGIFHSCSDGGDGVSYSVINLTSSFAQVSYSPAEGCLNPGDEIILVNMMGISTAYANTGNNEFLTVGTVIGDTIYFDRAKENYYGESSAQDDNIGVGTGQQRVVLQRVPNFENLTINGTLNVSNWNGYRGGLLVFRVSDTLDGSGEIIADGLGYGGGEGAEGGGGTGEAGTSYLGEGSGGTAANGGGGGGGAKSNNSGRAGAGGGYGTSGDSVLYSGIGGGIYGTEDLTELFIGSGGGGGGSRRVEGSDPGAEGDPGGGAIWILADQVSFTGEFSAEGSSADGNGGNGSGGGIRIDGDSVSLASAIMNVSGGSTYGHGGNGGDGRAAIYCSSSTNCSLPTGYDGYLEIVGDTDDDLLLSDDFEYGELSSQDNPWASFTSDTDFAISEEAERRGNYGLEAVIDGTTDMWVKKDNLGNLKEFHARMYINPESMSFGTGESLVFLRPDNSSTWGIAQVYLRKTTTYEVYVNVREDSLSFTGGSWESIGDDWTAIEIAWKSASYSGAEDGYMKLWIDGVLTTEITDLDNDTLSVDWFYLGTYSIGSNVSGTLYIDDFEARQYSYIGTLEAPDGEQPTPTPAAASWLESEYSYESSQPHAVSSITREQAGGGTVTDSFVYDNNGNMTCRDEAGQVWKQEYNAENRLSAVKKMNGTDCTSMGTATETWTFYYDGDGTRVKETHNDGSTTTTKLFLFGGSYEVVDNGTTETTKKYYSIAGMRVAMDDGTDLVYFAADHLSSSSIVMGATGSLLSENRYLPFGEVRDIASHTEITETDFTFTGQRGGYDFGWVDYHARFYSPTLGRFTQPDSIIPNMTNSQGWNRYAYVQNSPVMFIDPSGHVPSGPEDDPLIDDLDSTDQFYKDYLSYYYDWTLKGNWTLDELKSVHQAAKDIEDYVDGITDHRGREWMYEYLGDISISITKKSAGSGVPGRINLPNRWDGASKYDKYYLAHEFGHIWDINTGHIGILGAVDGPADHLNDFINVLANEDKSVFGKWADRFGGGTGKKHIPTKYLFTGGKMMYGSEPYGNKSTADYLAESFALNIYYPEKDWVHPHVTIFVNTYISVQAANLP